LDKGKEIIIKGRKPHLQCMKIEALVGDSNKYRKSKLVVPTDSFANCRYKL
jgi:hypothetical protein